MGVQKLLLDLFVNASFPPFTYIRLATCSGKKLLPDTANVPQTRWMVVPAEHGPLMRPLPSRDN